MRQSIGGTALLRDARHQQILILTLLLVVNLTWLDFGAGLLPSAVAVGATVASQIACCMAWRLPRLELRSAVITGLSLSLLLRGDSLWVPAAAGLIAMATKHGLRVHGKHVWNPSAVAIAALVFGSRHAWVSPGQWGASLWLAALLAFLAMIVLQASRRTDIVAFFLGCHAALLLGRAWWLGDPLAIPLHQMGNGSLLLFAFFMMSDPRTIPDARLGRFLFAATVAGLAFWMSFQLQIRPALYGALVLLSPLAPVIDRLFRAQRFEWRAMAQAGG